MSEAHPGAGPALRTGGCLACACLSTRPEGAQSAAFKLADGHTRKCSRQATPHHGTPPKHWQVALATLRLAESNINGNVAAVIPPSQQTYAGIARSRSSRPWSLRTSELYCAPSLSPLQLQLQPRNFLPIHQPMRCLCCNLHMPQLHLLMELLNCHWQTLQR